VQNFPAAFKKQPFKSHFSSCQLIQIIASCETGDFLLASASRGLMPGRYAGLIRGTVTASLMLIAMGGTGAAGPYEDAVIAYRRGDYTTAMQLFRPLADDGREGAQYYLGFMYYNGKGVAQDYARGRKVVSACC
jgi:hypothetical protein